MTGTVCAPRRRIARFPHVRDHNWSAPERAVVIAALTIVMGSLFLTTFTLALGDPVPHRIGAALVGDPTQHAQAVEAVEQVAEGSLSFRRYVSVAAARHAIDLQRVYAALDLTSARPTLYLASAAGASVARVLERVSATDPAVRVVDTHPLAASDPNGLDIFYLMLVATIVGFLTVFQVRANAGGLGLHHWTALIVGFALAARLTLTLAVDRFWIGSTCRWRRPGASSRSSSLRWRRSHRSCQCCRPLGDRPCLALLRRARQQLVWRRRLAASAAGAIRVHLAVASVGGHRHPASGRDLLPRLPAHAADPGSGGLGGGAVRRDACRVAPPPDEPGRRMNDRRDIRGSTEVDFGASRHARLAARREDSGTAAGRSCRHVRYRSTPSTWPRSARGPIADKGMAFTAHERRDLGLDGLLPPVVETLEQQAQRGYEAPVRGELPGIWTGAGAAALGLAGEVDEDGIQRSLNAQNPRPDVEALARGAHMSAGHLNREFRSPTAGRRTPTG